MVRRKKPTAYQHRLGGVFARLFSIVCLVALIPLCLLMEGCRLATIRPAGSTAPVTVSMEVTGYDNGPISCGWKRDWLGRPVYAYGAQKGKRKHVGITANGSRAKHGTVAADTRYYPFGTVLYIPGYGYGRVEDRGGAIKGPNKLDVWFPSEREALRWGRQKGVRVTVWKKPN